MNAVWFLCGMSVGLWPALVAARHPKAPQTDEGMRLLVKMFEDIEDKRRFVGRGLTIIRSAQLETAGETLTLSLASRGNGALLVHDTETD